MNSSDMSHIVAPEENMSNLQDAGTRVAVGESGALTSKKCGTCNGYHKF